MDSYPLDHQRNLKSVLFKKQFYWSIVDLRCCVNFCYTVKWLSFTYTFFFVFFSTVVYHRVLNRQYPVLYRRTLLFSHPIYNSSNLLIPNSQFFLPHPLPLWQRPVCSLCLWICFCFVNMFICVIFWILCIDNIIWYFFLTPLSMIISGCICIAANGIIWSSLWLSSIPLYIWATSLFIHLSNDV